MTSFFPFSLSVLGNPLTEIHQMAPKISPDALYAQGQSLPALRRVLPWSDGQSVSGQLPGSTATRADSQLPRRGGYKVIYEQVNSSFVPHPPICSYFNLEYAWPNYQLGERNYLWRKMFQCGHSSVHLRRAAGARGCTLTMKCQ